MECLPFSRRHSNFFLSIIDRGFGKQALPFTLMDVWVPLEELRMLGIRKPGDERLAHPSPETVDGKERT